MQPRSLQQVLSELDSVYNPQIDSIRQRQAAIPGQLQAEEQGLQAKQEQAYGDILNSARRRGLGFSGIPLGEQAKYSANEYMPALARLHTAAKDQASSLEDAIMGLNQQKYTQGQSIYENERNFAEQQRQFNEQMAQQRAQAAQAAASQINPSLGFSTPKGTAGLDSNFARQRQDGGFEFVDQYGRPISAAAYAVATGNPFRVVLQRMAEAGDKGAQKALGFVGNDFGYDPNKVSDSSTANLYNSLTWGVSRNATPYTPPKQQAPASRPAPAPQPAFRPVGMNTALPFSSLIGQRR